MSLTHTFETLEKNIKNLQLNFTQIVTSGCHYNTTEIINHIKTINNALDNIKLDYEFQRSSKDIAKQFNTNDIKANETNIQQLIAKGNDLTQQLNIRLHREAIKNKEPNQLHELHKWACESLFEYLQALEPYASSSYARLDNMAHHLGVTDRYVGYRNNLTRYDNIPNIWANRKLPQTSASTGNNWTPTVYRHIPSSTTATNDNQYPNTTKQISSYSFISPPLTNDSNFSSDRENISTGQSETTDRYRKPEYSSTFPYMPVAQPDYTLIGRPLARLESKLSTTEYTDRYPYPDASKIERYPWLRS